MAERTYFLACLVAGRLLRGSGYSKTVISRRADMLEARKHRLFYAPLLVWLGDALVKVLDTGVVVLHQREWEDRERELYHRLYNTAVHVDENGTLVLPFLEGETLACLLEKRQLSEPDRDRAITLAVDALAALHRRGVTHGDAMAENVMVDLDNDVAHWFDFETMHEPGRTLLWRCADDLRALLATTLLRSSPAQFASTLDRILDTYGNEEIVNPLSVSFSAKLRRPLPFHLGQAGLSFRQHREIERLLVTPKSR